MTTDYAGLTAHIVKRIVDNPDAVAVTAQPHSRGIEVEIGVADSDVGKVIGKGGRNIESIRAVVRAAGLRQHERVQVELSSDDDPHDRVVRDDEPDTPEPTGDPT